MAFGKRAFRIKYDNVKKYITPVEELGGKFIYGKDLKESDFLEPSKNYDYVYLAFGLTKVKTLGIPREDIKGLKYIALLL